MKKMLIPDQLEKAVQELVEDFNRPPPKPIRRKEPLTEAQLRQLKTAIMAGVGAYNKLNLIRERFVDKYELRHLTKSDARWFEAVLNRYDAILDKVRES